MAKDQPIPPPDGSLLVWAMNNPEAVKNAVQYLNLLLALQVKLVRGGVSTMNQQSTMILSGENILLPIPLLWGNGVPPALAGGAVLADVIATVNLILSGERSIQSGLL